MRITHFAFDLRLWDQGRHRIDHDHVNGIAADQDFSNFEGLFAKIGLADQQILYNDTDLPSVIDVQGVFRINEGRQPAPLLRLSDDVQGKGGFSRRLRPKDLDNPPTSHPPNPQGQIQG